MRSSFWFALLANGRAPRGDTASTAKRAMGFLWTDILRSCAARRSDRRIRATIALAITAIIALISGAARAELPSVKLMTGPLISPSSAWSYYGSGTTHTVGPIGWMSSTRPAEIKELARALSRGGALTGDAHAAAVADYVRDNIETEFSFGLSKGAHGGLIDQSGTQFDQVHLMVAGLREGDAAASARAVVVEEGR